MRYIIAFSLLFIGSVVFADDYNLVSGTGAIFITDTATGETITVTTEN